MTQDQKTPEEIAHLDFEVEKEKTHFAHPIDPMLRWCGEPRLTPPVQPGSGLNRQITAADVTCVNCLHLHIEKGIDWWWRVNKAWYGT